MFVYEFMSGIVETITGTGESEDGDYDPHQHRKVEKPTTYSETMIHMLKGSIGAGILAMPSAVQRLGIIVSIVGLMLIGFLATYCILLLIAAQYELCKRWRRGYIAYPKSMMLAIRDGPPGIRWSAMSLYYFVEVVLIFWQLGICVIFFVFVAENVKQICDFHGYEASLRLHLCFVLVPTILLNLVKDLKLMTPLSSISNIVTIFGLILVFFYLIEDDVVLDSEKLRLKSFNEIPLFIGTALFALEAVGVILALEYNMEEPKRFVGMLGLYSIGMISIIVLYLVVGVFGYLKYGEEIKATITLNLPQEQKKAQAAKLIFALAIFLTFPLQNYVAYNMVWRRAKKKLPESKHMVTDYTLRIALVIIPWTLAVAVPHLGPFISLFGAFCLSLLGIIFPGLMDLCIWYPNNYGVLHYKCIRDVFIMIIGVACLFSGCYTSVVEIIAEW
ncbi:PREDICTED: proton-coupled amino acid transporter 4-like [Papilio polytes]|uniref:proton-coupled amino acid transporter 4-like n=1 Tax=Papilio polytes TaxID=76194 RepID=UPI0006768B32|nr:PREDICTED: proton-coupled amino acid transporter 4-like [Papilio polytes]